MVASSIGTHPASANEDRILRVWTPILLRSILIVATTILVVGLILTHEISPGYYVQRYNAAKSAHFLEKTDFFPMLGKALHGDPHSVMTTGLFTLTLVPLARVAFCFLLFLRERDYAYVGFTAYVLAGLVVGMLLGSAG